MKKHFIKRQVNKNFILSLTLVALLAAVVVGEVWLLRTLASDESFMWMTFGIGILGIALLAVATVLTAALAFFIFIFALIARLVHKDMPERIRAYRVLMGFSYAGQIFLLLCSIPGILSGGWESVIDVIISAYIFWAIFIGMRGTYTERIKES